MNRHRPFASLSRRRLTRSGLVLACAALLATTSPAQVTIGHDPVGCLVADTFPVLQAELGSEAGIARARVYFRARGEDLWYYVEMEPRPPLFEAVLPKPLAGIGGVDYYLEAFDQSFAESRTEEYAAEVIPDSQSCRPGMATAGALGSVPALLVGAPAGAPVVPVGFAGTSVVGSVAGTGVAGTTSAGGATGAGTAAGAAAGGLSVGVIAGGLAAAAATGVAVAAGGGDDDGGSTATRPDPTPAPTPQPTPEPTPTPDPGITGRWVGTTVDDPSSVFCSLDTALTMDLQQTGGSVTGTYESRVTAVRSPPQDPCEESVGDVSTGAVTGSVEGTSVALQLAFQFPGAEPGQARAEGTISGSSMSGRFVADDGSVGSWEVTRR